MSLYIQLTLAILIFQNLSQAPCYATLCDTADECTRGHCCVALSILALQTKGICVPYTKRDIICSEPNSAIQNYGGKYLLYCPCEEGLTCRPAYSPHGVIRSLEYLLSLRCLDTPDQPPPAPANTTVPAGGYPDLYPDKYGPEVYEHGHYDKKYGWKKDDLYDHGVYDKKFPWKKDIFDGHKPFDKKLWEEKWKGYGSKSS